MIVLFWDGVFMAGWRHWLRLAVLFTVGRMVDWSGSGLVDGLEEGQKCSGCLSGNGLNG